MRNQIWKNLKKFIALFMATSIIISLSVPPLYASSEAAISPALAVGSDHTLILRGDGTVWSVGLNDFGQLGDGTIVSKATPVEVKGLSGIIAIAAGGSTSLALKNDGTVWAWGSNETGQLGMSGSLYSTVPVQIPGLTDVQSIQTDGDTVIVLKNDGTLWGWGDNGFGELGDGTANDNPNPVPEPIPGMTDIKTFAVGATGSVFAVKDEGTVWAWGRNDSGQLGDGTTDNRYSPVQLTGLNNVIALAGGWFYTLALKSDGTVWSWGSNDANQLGNADSTTANRPQPMVIPGLNNIVSLAAGSEFGLALDKDGQLWGWGGGLMLGTNSNPLGEKQLLLSNVSSITTGLLQKFVIGQDGTVWAWGQNRYGELGDGTQTDRSKPVKSLISDVFYPLAIISVTPADFASIDASRSITITFNEDIRPYTVNNNNFQLFDLDGKQIPVQVMMQNARTVVMLPNAALIPGQDYYFVIQGVLDQNGLSMAKPYQSFFTVQQAGDFSSVKITAGAFQNLAITGDGRVWAWGDNSDGQLGIGTETSRYLPVQVPELAGIVAVSSGVDHSAAVRSDGTLWTWGKNDKGQLGNGTTTDSLTPVQANINNVQAVAVGTDFTIALKKDGTVWGWGDNSDGKADEQNSVYITSPTMLTGLNDVVVIAAGNSQSLALKKDGTVWAWGDNSKGQLGTGSTNRQFTPVQVQGLSDVIAIAAGGDHNLALKSDGTVWAWGDNQYNEISYIEPATVTTPVQIDNLDHITSIAAGFAHNLALKDDGTVWTWGNNNVGQLGYGNNQKNIVPEQIPGLNDVAEIGAGYLHSVVRKQDGSVWSWGFNGDGELGTGALENYSEPVQTLLNNQPVAHRISGTDRIGTAIAVSQEGWENGSSYVILTRDDDFPDALAGTTLANVLDAPILLTDKSELTPATEAEITRLGAKNIIILGGTGAVSGNIESYLKSKNLTVTRIGGKDRFDTAAQIALVVNQILGPNSSNKVVLANGNGFADALEVSSWAAYNHVPILLTDAQELPVTTVDALQSLGYPTVIAVGGTGVISDSVLESATTIPGKSVRYGGSDRYETAIAIARGLQSDANTVFIATGLNFPDALAGSVLASRTESPIILTDATLSSTVISYLEDNNKITKNVFILGGEGVVPNSVVNAMMQLIQPKN